MTEQKRPDMPMGMMGMGMSDLAKQAQTSVPRADDKETRIKLMREQKKNEYWCAEVKCPACGETFTAGDRLYCSKCFTMIFELDGGGRTRLVEVSGEDKGKEFGVTRGGLTETRKAGDVVEFELPTLTDCSQTVTVNGGELVTGSDGKYRFIMPAHGVTIEFRTENGMGARSLP